MARIGRPKKKVVAESAPVVIEKPKETKKAFVTEDQVLVEKIWYAAKICPYSVTGGKSYSDDPDEELLTPLKYHFRQTEAELMKYIK